MGMRKHKRVMQARLKHDLFYNFPIAQWLDRFKMIPTPPEVRRISEEFCKEIFKEGKTFTVEGQEVFCVDTSVHQQIMKRIEQEVLLGNELPGSNVVFEGATD